MLGLKLRQEFQGGRLKGTAIELTNDKNTGATQIPASNFLGITYPSYDLLKAIEAIGPNQSLPVVLKGERGQGKSHLEAALYHILTNAEEAKSWLQHWSSQLENSRLAELDLRSGMHVISESLHRQQYKFLWDLILDRHPHGQYIREKWEAMGDKKTDVPPYDLLLKLLKNQPTALILDEFQTWYDGLTNTKQYPWRTWAFNFIQLLSEIAQEQPDLLVLVVSVRNGSTDAYQQIHRINPVVVDFKGPNAALDRRRLLLHRLFENRLQLNEDDIATLIATHVSEYFRLTLVPPADFERHQREFIESWPYSPILMRLLEDQVLVATSAQETRDLIKILADLFKGAGASNPIVTAADFKLDDDATQIATLLDSVSNQYHASLREKAQRNLTAVQAVVKGNEVPHLSEIVGALWLRSLAVENLAGAEPATLQIDITRSQPIDDNAFQVELATIVDNSFNIHPHGNRYSFREDENATTKLMAHARNDRLFTDGSDDAELAKQVRYILGGSEAVARSFRLIVLPQTWLKDPWSTLDPSEHPDRWGDRLPILVLPEEPDKFNERLGTWLKEHVQRLRNTIRFLLPKSGTTNIYQDRELLVLARAIMVADQWKAQSSEYRGIKTRYEKELKDKLKNQFDRFALLNSWNYADPKRCEFIVEGVKAQGDKIPDAIEDRIRKDVFIPEDFEEYVRDAAENRDSVGKLLRELQEPRPGGKDCIPWLGETQVKERLIRVCARGGIAINLRDLEYLQANPGEDEAAAWHRMKGRQLGTGRHLDETKLLPTQSVPSSDGVEPQPNVPTSSIPQPNLELGNGITDDVSLPTATPSDAENSGSNGYPGDLPPSSSANESSDGSIFDDPQPTSVARRTSPATSALNLYAKVSDEWGIGPATPVQNLSLKVGALTGAQLQKLLKSLPDGLTYELDLEKEEN
ncbi:DUF499 domain-containing protein [Prochlorothrix hollandica]|uniref:DUF499 domain-containing protein n=2 Tax=Prochlorothrix hollandica TaxID=1223 RepID=A0A0M2PZD0_PROHO|nr:DUF499 domain-containing protein [Prochlorothrix hollandica]KKJ00054.1 hypothetical protein PROH_09850 [Prochlorothrix hollandica PCC 9006 = CALU 1027]